MNQYENKLTFSPPGSTTSTTSSGSPLTDRRGGCGAARHDDDEDENSTRGERTRYPSEETDDSSNFALPMFQRRNEHYDREDFSNFQPFPPVSSNKSLILKPSKPVQWEQASELMNQYTNAKLGVIGCDTFDNNLLKPEVPASVGSGANGPSIFQYMELIKAGNFAGPPPTVHEGSGRSDGLHNGMANCNMLDMKDLEDALKQLRMNESNRCSPAIYSAVSTLALQQQTLANLQALIQTSENLRKQNSFNASDAMLLPKIMPKRDVMAMPGGCGVSQEPRYCFDEGVSGNTGMGMRPLLRPTPPYPNSGRMNIRTTFGQLGHKPSDLDSPHGFAIGRSEEIVVADTYHHMIKIFDKNGTFLGKFGHPGKEIGHLWHPRKVAILRHSGHFVVCDRGEERSRMQIFNEGGRFIKQINIKFVDIVAGLATTPDGKIVVVDSVRPTIFIIDPDSRIPLRYFEVAHLMMEPSDISIYKNNFYVCDFKGHAIVVVNFDGQLVGRISTENLSLFPNGVDVSDQGDILVGDSHGNQFHVAVFDCHGQFMSHFICPDIKVSRCCGLKITSEGYIVTVAKNNHHVLVLDTLFI